MNLFEFYLPVEILFGWGSVEKLGYVAKRFGFRALIVTGRHSTKKYGYLEKAIEALRNYGVTEIVVFDEVEPNPTDKTVNKASEIAVKEKVDFVVGLGGGSALDSAKAVSIVSSNEGYAWDYVNYPEGSRLIPFLNRPVICVPTTAGTGSEVNRYSVISNPVRKEKLVISHSLNYPKVAVVDPSLTSSMDRKLTAITGIDAFMHALESLTNKVYNPLADELAIKAIKIIKDWLTVAIEEPSSKEARTQMAYASMLAGIAIDRKRVALIHAMEHPVSAHYPEVAHGEGLAALAVAVTKFNYSGNPDRYALFAELMGYDGKPHKAVDALERFLEKVGMRVSLKDLNVEKDKLPKLAEDVYMTGRGIFTINPIEPSIDDVYRIYQEAYI